MVYLDILVPVSCVVVAMGEIGLARNSPPISYMRVTANDTPAPIR